MTTIVFGGDGSAVNDWTGLLDRDQVTDGTLIYLVSTSTVPPAFRGYTGQIEEGRSASHLRAFDGGVEITRGPDYSTDAEMFSESPEPGHVRWHFGDGDGTYIRLGSEPVFDLRVLAFGYPSESSPPWSQIQFFEEIDETVVSHGRLHVSARFVTDPSTTYLDVLNDSAQKNQQWFGFNRQDEFEVGSLKEPTGDPVYTFGFNNTLSLRIAPPEGAPLPVYKLVVNDGETWPSSLANGAPRRSRDEMQREPVFRVWTYADTAILFKHRNAPVAEITSRERMLQNNFAWTLFRQRFMGLFGNERHQVTVTCAINSNTLALDLNDVVRVQIPRMGWGAGKLFRIVVQRLDLAVMRAEFVLWG